MRTSRVACAGTASKADFNEPNDSKMSVIGDVHESTFLLSEEIEFKVLGLQLLDLALC